MYVIDQVNEEGIGFVNSCYASPRNVKLIAQNIADHLTHGARVPARFNPTENENIAEVVRIMYVGEQGKLAVNDLLFKIIRFPAGEKNSIMVVPKEKEYMDYLTERIIVPHDSEDKTLYD
jgi:hypothetical protein